MPRLLIVLALALAIAPAATAQERVTGDMLRPHVLTLFDIAKSNGGNRAAGLPGETATVDYIAGRLEQFGWQVTRQKVPFPYYDVRSAPVLGGLRPGRDFTVMRYSAAANATGRVVVLRSEDCTRASLRRVRRGDVVVMPRLYYCGLRQAAVGIRRRGGVALVVPVGRSFPLTPTSFSPDVPIPVFLTSDRAARRLRGRIPVKVDAAIDKRQAENVIADLPGRGGSRVVAAGGHLDSVPEGPGMNDNASGIALLLAAAERLAAGPRPRDTVRLGFWSAEEWGLYGSRHYVRTLPRPEQRRLRAYMNFDMVGSPNGAPDVYTSRNAASTALRAGLPGAGRTPHDSADSDHDPFRRAGVPISGVYTGGLEDKTRAEARRWGGFAGRMRDRCYHRACDTKPNIQLLARVSTAALAALRRLAGP